MEYSTNNADECKEPQASISKLTKIANYLGIWKIKEIPKEVQKIKEIEVSEESKVKASAIGVGIGTVAAGAYIGTIASGFFPIMVVHLLMGAGGTLVIAPIVKHYKDETLDKNELVKDVGLGAAIGLATGPFGYGASELSQAATSGVSKFGIRTIFSSGAGAASKAVMEGARYLQGGVVSTTSFFKSVGQGAIAGSVGGALGHTFNSSATLPRIIGQGTTAAAMDAGLQYHEKGEVDPKQTAIMAASQMAVAATAEAGSSMAQKTSAYTNKVNNDRIDRKVKSGELSASEGEFRKQQMKALNEEFPKDFKGDKRIGDYDAHNLRDRSSGKREGQVAFSTDSNNNGARGIAEKHNGKLIYLDETTDHNYRGLAETIKGKLPNPIENLKATKLGVLLKKDDEDIKEGSKRNVLVDYASNIKDYIKSKL